MKSVHYLELLEKETLMFMVPMRNLLYLLLIDIPTGDVTLHTDNVVIHFLT